MFGESKVSRGVSQRPVFAAAIALPLIAAVSLFLPAASPGDPASVAAGSGGASSSAAVKITKVKLIPHRGWMYRDGYFNMQVQVTNRGNGIARGIDLYLSSSRKKVTVPRKLRFHRILPGWTNTKTFKVKAKRSVRGWVMIEAQAWGKRNRSFLRLIKPWWPA